jgi:hypothetical protein
LHRKPVVLEEDLIDEKRISEDLRLCFNIDGEEYIREKQRVLMASSEPRPTSSAVD